MNAPSKVAAEPCACPDHTDHPSSVSRRTLLAGMAVSPTIGAPALSAVPDNIVVLWEEWQAGMVKAEALRDAWCREEQALLRRVGAKRFDEAVKSGLPDAKGFLDVERRQRDLGRTLDDLVNKIVAQPAETHLGIAAKLLLALELADPGERADPSWSLVESALNELGCTCPQGSSSDLMLIMNTAWSAKYKHKAKL